MRGRDASSLISNAHNTGNPAAPPLSVNHFQARVLHPGWIEWTSGLGLRHISSLLKCSATRLGCAVRRAPDSTLSSIEMLG